MQTQTSQPIRSFGEEIFFQFCGAFGSRFSLDGTYYTLLSTKPTLPQKPYKYTAKFISKDGNTIQVALVGKRNQSECFVLIEVK